MYKRKYYYTHLDNINEIKTEQDDMIKDVIKQKLIEKEKLIQIEKQKLKQQKEFRKKVKNNKKKLLEELKIHFQKILDPLYDYKIFAKSVKSQTNKKEYKLCFIIFIYCNHKSFVFSLFG